MIPYPWDRERTKAVKRGLTSRFSTIIGIPAAIVATLIGGPIPLIVGIVLALRWQRTNANPAGYGLIMFGSGAALASLMTLWNGGPVTLFIGIVLPLLLIAYAWWSPTISVKHATYAYIGAFELMVLTALWAATGGFSGIDKHVFSLTRPVSDGPVPISTLPSLWIVWFPYGLIIGSITLYLWCTNRDYKTQRFLEPRKETIVAKHRLQRTVAKYTDHQPDKALVPAVVVGDRLPWRQDRIGVPVVLPIDDEMGHGLVLGANGTGKTVFGLTLSEQSINKGMASMYLCFKGDLKVRDKLSEMADDAGAEFYSFDIRLGGNDESDCYFDPLDFDGDRNQKASIVLQSFEFETTDEAYYRAASEEWMPLQFAILEAVGLEEGQGTFDFLDSTASVASAKERISLLKDTDPGIYNRIMSSISTMDDSRLEGLRTNIRRITKSPAGARMRKPTRRETDNGARYIDVRNLAGDNNSVVFFGLGVGGQGPLAKMLGALVVFAIGSFVDWRNSHPEAARDDYFLLADEFGLLEEYSDMFKFLITNARSARVWVWVMSQSLTSFTDAIAQELITNAYWFVVFRIADVETTERLASTTGKISYRSEMTEASVQETASGGRNMNVSGGVRMSLVPDDHIRPERFTKLRPREAFIWSNGPNEPSDRTQWWRRTRATFKEPRFGEAEAAKDIPVVRAIPSLIVIRDGDESLTPVIIDGDVDTPELVQPSSPQQRSTLHMIGRWVGDNEVTQGLRDEEVVGISDLTRDQASRLIDRLVAHHMRNLHAAAGDDRYLTEYNKVARYAHRPALSGTADIENSYHSLPVAGVRTLHEQLGGHSIAPTANRTHSAGFADDDAPAPTPEPAPADTSFEWGALDDEPPPDPQTADPTPDDNPPAPEQNTETLPELAPHPAPVSTVSATPSVQSPTPARAVGFADDEDEHDLRPVFTNPHPAPEQPTDSVPTSSSDGPEPHEQSTEPAVLTDTSTTDETAQSRDDTPDTAPETDETAAADENLSPEAQHMWTLYERAYDLINVDPDTYGMPELDGDDYYWLGGEHGGVPVKPSAFKRAYADAQMQIPPLD